MIQLENIHKTYNNGQPLHVLKGINLHIERGEFVSIMGASGSGKSTLLNILGILDNYDEGSYYLDGKLIRDLSESKAADYRNRMIGFVFQSFNLIPFKNALENVALPLFYRGVNRKRRNALALEYLDRLGILSPRLLAAHTLWVTPHDIELLAAHGVHCIHNINSNTKLASGYRFMYNEMRDAGINVCLGTDGCASSNNLDMLEAMKTSAIFQKAWRDDPSALPLDELLDMATVNGARALRFDGGRIAEGAVADISIIDTDNTFFLSPGPFLANFIYSAHSDCIDSVICDGKFLMRHREIPGEKEIISEARKVLAKIS